MSFDNLSSLSLMRTSESFSDLNAELTGASSGSGVRAPGRSSLASLRATGGQAGATNGVTPASTGAEECNNNSSSSSNNNNKPFGLGKP
jgi:hypothetical protein